MAACFHKEGLVSGNQSVNHGINILLTNPYKAAVYVLYSRYSLVK